MAKMLLLRWKTFSGSIKVVFGDVRRTFTRVKMLYCYLVLQDRSVWTEKPFVLCRGVIFLLSLVSFRGSRASTGKHFSGKCLAKSLSDFGPLLCLTYSLVAMAMLLLSQWLQMPEKGVFLPRSSPFWLAWWEGGSTVCDEEDTLRPWSVVISPPAPPPPPSVFTLGSAGPREESWSS